MMKTRNYAGMVTAAALLAAIDVSALMIVEDFDSYEEGSLIYGSGGSGFRDHWSSGNMNVVTGLNLSYSATGYAVTSLGAGMCTASNDSSALLSFRTFAAPITGTAEGRAVWFSTLVRPKSMNRIGWHFNPTTQSRTEADAGFLIVDTDFRVLSNGVLIATGLTLAYNTTHLVLGRVLLKDTGASTVSIWLDPGDVSSTGALGTATLTYPTDFGGSLTKIGMEGYRNDTAAMDALRISDGTGDADQAFLDVTRATSPILFGPVEFGSLAELTNQFALVNASVNDWTPNNDGNYGKGGYLKPVSTVTHHTFVIDSDGAIGGGNDVFGDCTIDYDCRGGFCGVHYLGTDPSLRTPKHWTLVMPGTTHEVRAYYNRNMTANTGHTLETNAVYSLDGSTWRHVRVDVRRVYRLSVYQVESRVRVWDNAHDFRQTPSFDATFTYAAAHSHLVAGEIGFSGYYASSGSPSGEIDNVAVYRYGAAPDWFKPKGTLMVLD